MSSRPQMSPTSSSNGLSRSASPFRGIRHDRVCTAPRRSRGPPCTSHRRSVYEYGPSGYTRVNGTGRANKGDVRVSSYRRVVCSMLVVVAVSLAAPSLASAEGEPAPFGHACRAQNGVRFCPTEGLGQRVASFDGVPLDVDVTLPASGTGPFPTIVMLHGWGGSKTDFESTMPAGDGNETFDYNNIYYAQHGYAVLNYSARGWGNSCGAPASREDPGCKEGWLRLADQRYEARDTQYLLGLLADEQVTKPGAIGTTGISYG